MVFLYSYEFRTVCVLEDTSGRCLKVFKKSLEITEKEGFWYGLGEGICLGERGMKYSLFPLVGIITLVVIGEYWMERGYSFCFCREWKKIFLILTV
jgi:hypothetical protein